ncbi:MAG TPA: hypothetical protein PKY30_04635 [Myxococcota bacterium]|nr:hypothetical protein [Myxococcota bacterium]
MLLSLLSLVSAAPADAEGAWAFEKWAESARMRPVERRVDPPRGGADLLNGYQYGDLFILQDDDGEWFTSAIQSVGSGNFDYVTNSFINAFYRDNPDNYDYLTVVMLKDLSLFFAFYQPVANDVLGIGYDSITPGEVFDQDSSNKMQGFIFMNYEGLWTGNPESGRYVFGQEFMHRWGSFVNADVDGLPDDFLLGRDTAHWSYWFNTTNSPMEGNTWVDNEDGTWTTDRRAGSTYSDLDLYLMGLLDAESVGTQTFLSVSEEEQARVGLEPASSPEYFNCTMGACADVTVTATPVNFGLDAIVSAEGARVPSAADSPKSFRMAIIVLALQGDYVDGSLERVDGLRQTWERDWEEDVRGAADLITTLDQSTAATWGEPTDSGPVDSAVDSSADDSGNGVKDTGKEVAGPDCGCNAAPGGLLGLGLGLGLLAAQRRRRA